ncbi:MAG: DNA repair protein RecO [Nitrospirae bacterium RBG_13_39_12]|nr:MAG: DNA repair protein RecO [Nitrospirae bacterium RBG_13_39_12]
MLHRTEGIVLKTFPLGEADLIVTYISPDFGLLKVFAKSPRKIKSRFGSSLEPLTRSRISFWGKEDAALPKLTQSDIIHPFQLIRENLNCFLKVSEIIELTINFMPERDANKKVYSLLLNTLHDFENNSSSPSRNKGVNKIISYDNLMITHHKIKFLHFVGYAPKLDACGGCGKSGRSFYISQGSIICEACAKGIDFPIRLSPAALKLYHDLLSWDIFKIKRIKPSNMLLSGLSDIINLHIRYILDKPLKTETFICSLSQHFNA